jgi:15-cis-phytoene synthase
MDERGGAPGQAQDADSVTAAQISLDAAYAECRSIARREAKNFYYSFVALPKPRRNAICAIYAFMRKADDLADDETLSLNDRRKNLAGWIARWHAAAQGRSTTDAVFIAVRDAVARFHIPLSLLDELIAGVTMDLDRAAQDGPDTYATFADLYKYCYLVASVVGLVCIRIFGYKDARAEKLAEETGIAFQLTNILRDVKEDAERRRVYLPLDELAKHGVKLDELIQHSIAGSPTASERALLKEMARRAEVYYQSARLLLPLIDKESRPALWVLVKIYRGLLRRIERSNYDVYSQRASVSKMEKLTILSVGMAKMAWFRVSIRVFG